MHHPRLEENVLKDQTSHFFNLAKCHHKSDKYVFCKKKKIPFQNNRLEQS